MVLFSVEFLCVFVNTITFMRASYGQKTGRVRKWFHAAALNIAEWALPVGSL